MAKKHHIFLLLFVFSALLLHAQDAPRHSVSADVTGQGVVGFSNTYKWYGGVDLKGVLHVDDNDFHLNFEALTANVYSIGLSARPNIQLCRNGFGFVDVTLHSRIFGRYKISEFIYSASLGFRMRHFEVQVGLFNRVIDSFSRDWHSVESYVSEPFNLLYRLKISIMGFDHPWDVYLVGGNFNEYEYERMWEPIFSLGGRWDMNEKMSLVAEGTLEPAGMFHGTAKFYEAIFRIGVNYKIQGR